MISSKYLYGICLENRADIAKFRDRYRGRYRNRYRRAKLSLGEEEV